MTNLKVTLTLLLCLSFHLSVLSSKDNLDVYRKDSLDHSVDIIASTTIAAFGGMFLENVVTEVIGKYTHPQSNRELSTLQTVYESIPVEIIRFVVAGIITLKGLHLLKKDSLIAHSLTAHIPQKLNKKLSSALNNDLVISFIPTLFFVIAGRYFYQSLHKILENWPDNFFKKYSPVFFTGLFESTGLAFIDSFIGSLILHSRLLYRSSRRPTQLEYTSLASIALFALAVQQHLAIPAHY